MASKEHWLNEIAAAVRERAMASVDDIAARLIDTVPFGGPPPAPVKPDLDAFLQAPPDQRRAYLQSLGPEYGATISDLMAQANSRYGALAAKLLPIFQMDEAASQVQEMEANQQTGLEGEMGTALARADLAELLGIDPFAV